MEGSVRKRLRQRFNQLSLPSIVLTNVGSFSNKVGITQTHTRYYRRFGAASLSCFTESWLQSTMADSFLFLKSLDSTLCKQTVMETRGKPGKAVSASMIYDAVTM